jgi:chromosomal replication initiation ATPase DnaA
MSTPEPDPSSPPADPILPLRVRFIVARVAALHRIPREMMFDARRTAPLMAARRHAWAELLELVKPDGQPTSSVQIGRWFGVDHSTVLRGVRQHRSGRYPFTKPGRAGR